VPIYILHAAQAVKGWPKITIEDREEGARLADAMASLPASTPN